MTPEEREEIINAAVERALLKIPEVVGNLITNEMRLIKLNKKFYEQYPEFASNKQLVASVVEEVESKAPGTDYEKVLQKAVPIIRERMKTVSNLNNLVKRPSRNLANLNLDNGEL